MYRHRAQAVLPAAQAQTQTQHGAALTKRRRLVVAAAAAAAAERRYEAMCLRHRAPEAAPQKRGAAQPLRPRATAAAAAAAAAAALRAAAATAGCAALAACQHCLRQGPLRGVVVEEQPRGRQQRSAGVLLGSQQRRAEPAELGRGERVLGDQLEPVHDTPAAVAARVERRGELHRARRDAHDLHARHHHRLVERERQILGEQPSRYPEPAPARARLLLLLLLLLLLMLLLMLLLLLLLPPDPPPVLGTR